MQFTGANDLDRTYLGGGGDEDTGWKYEMYGDYYRDPDDVVRGVTTATGVQECFGFAGISDGDFYRDTGDTCKGLSLGMGMDEPPFFGGVPLPGDLQGKFEMGFASAEILPKYCGAIDRFTEVDEPPPAPSGPFASLEKTSVFISSCSPCDIGNTVLDLFEQQLTATITKVGKKKMTVKAEVFEDGSMCTIKVRIYKYKQDPSDLYAVEFQPRSGDRFVFGRVFQEATKYLEKHVEVSLLPTAPRPVLTPPPPSNVRPAADQAGPLLSMAVNAEHPHLQAEAAAALAEMAQDSRSSTAFCTAEAFKAFKALLQAQQPEIAQPTGQLLYLLAPYGEAAQWFADDELLPAIIHKVQDGALGPRLRNKFAEVLKDALYRCASALSPIAAAKVNAALDKAINSKAVDSSSRRTLQDAKLCLNC